VWKGPSSEASMALAPAVPFLRSSRFRSTR
jgi:hypothetical protein